jgi:chromatin segregation and condensation protein Rec8/ScpA/Scc1 (kleisin family)
LGKRGEVKEIAAETITVEDKIKEICDCLGSSPEGIDFEALFTLRTAAEGDLPQAKGLSYLEVVVTFLAILELAKRRLIRIVQGGDFGTIRIFGVIH